MSPVAGLYRALCWATAALLVGCSGHEPARVVDRSDRAAVPRQQRLAVVTTPPSSYRVRKGDTLYSISFRYGLDYRRVASWNQIAAPYRIYPGQQIRFSKPAKPLKTKKSVASTSTSHPVTTAPRKAPKRSSKKADRKTATSKPIPKPTPRVPASSGPVTWSWPTKGTLISQFSANGGKGINISGKRGQKVVAAASGEVVYSGNGLIGYGELIIVKHSGVLLSAYGHNRKRLVKEGESVKKGEKIAELGSTGTDRPQLHFEIRKNGKPVNPINYLP